MKRKSLESHRYRHCHRTSELISVPTKAKHNIKMRILKRIKYVKDSPKNLTEKSFSFRGLRRSFSSLRSSQRLSIDKEYFCLDDDDDNDNEDQSVINFYPTESSSSSSSLSLSSEDIDVQGIFEACVSDLRNEVECNDDDNRNDDGNNNNGGMENILEAAKGVIEKNKLSCDAIAKAIVYGGKRGSINETLRSFLLRFLCHDNVGDDDESVYSDDDDDYREDREEVKSPKSEKDLPRNIFSFQLVTHSLEFILSSESDEAEPIDFKDKFWMKTVASLIHNIETMEDDKITGISLKCLRLLSSLEPVLMKQMMQQSLMPYVIHLKEYGECQKCPMIESEASRLIRMADIQATRYITI